jgi:hypothetical protein
MPFAGLVPLHTDRPVDEIKDIRGKLDVVRLPRHLGNTAGASPGDEPGGDPDDLDKKKPVPASSMHPETLETRHAGLCPTCERPSSQPRP